MAMKNKELILLLFVVINNVYGFHIERKSAVLRGRTCWNGSSWSNRRAGRSGALMRASPEDKEEDAKEISKRVSQLEQLVAKQTGEILQLQSESQTLREACESFARVLSLLKQAGLFSVLDGMEVEASSAVQQQKKKKKKKRKEEKIST
eukprot:12253246-Ditylum_brightwellii.AAC.1